MEAPHDPCPCASNAVTGQDSGPRAASDRIFVGREPESARLRACADGVRAGASWLAVVEGEAGIGKSALLRHCAAEALDGFTVLWAVGDPSETDLPGGVLAQLTRQAHQALPTRLSPTVPEPLPASLTAHTLGGQLLLLLGALQESERPVAVMVDDVQWADPLSVRALGFVLRRLWADRVLTVLATRPGEDEVAEVLGRLPRSLERAVKLELRGLGGDDVARLAQGLVEGRLAPGLGERLYAYTQGHPLYVRTVLAEVPPAALRDGVLERWPVPPSLRVGIRAQLNRLPRESRELLSGLAVLDSRVPLATAGRVAGVTDPVRALGPALSCGLAQWWPMEHRSPVALVHALQRDAVYTSLTPERRRALHAEAALHIGTAASWAHRVAAATTADPALADELERAGTEEASAGRNALAATRLLWASSLTEDRTDRERRLLTACAQSLLTMRPTWAVQHRQQVEECAPGPLRDSVLGVMDMMAGRFSTAEAHLQRSWQQALSQHRSGEPGADRVAVLAGTFLANIALWNGRGEQAVEVGRQTLAIGDLDAATTDFTRAALATGRLWHLGPRAALADLDHLPQTGQAVADHHLDSLATRGVLRLFLGELGRARADLSTVAERDRRGAASKLGPLTLSLLSVTHYLAGDWDAGESAADRALAVAAAGEQLLGDAAARFAAVCVRSGRGEWADAEHHMDRLSHLAQTLGSSVEIVYLGLAGATLAQARADHPAVLRALRPLLDDAAQPGGGPRLIHKPFWLWQQSLLVESLTGTGRLDEATAALHDLREAFDGTGYLQVVTARLTGQLAEARGRPRDALDAYGQALADATAVPPGTRADDSPLHLALLEQAHGRTLLASGSGPRREAAAWLNAARDRFAALRAAPFVRRCEADLAVGGLGTPREAPGRRSSLTERELSVAYAVAGGLTNQEAAAELYVSQKTVEYHLSRIYTKLAISSRRALAAALDSEGLPAPTPSPVPKPAPAPLHPLDQGANG
ncbi:AAA family ATPase [Streptomyces sp. NPDC005281]|uniref:helix-turn-helix transcriptional regulator n=1 Tax=Streptomyces sp. NPDC005281 TaxID=3155712 RepID=UPI0033AC6916